MLETTVVPVTLIPDEDGALTEGDIMGRSADFRRYRPANENGFAQTEDIQEPPTRIENQTGSVDVAEATVGSIISTWKERDVRRALRLRASRAEIFGDGLFGEPAWDMLLRLYAAHLSGRTESISNVCLASGVPPSAALRWLQHLQGEGWIERSFDPYGRQFLIALSAKSRIAMKRLFGHAPDQIPEFRWHLRIGRGL